MRFPFKPPEGTHPANGNPYCLKSLSLPLISAAVGKGHRLTGSEKCLAWPTGAL